MNRLVDSFWRAAAYCLHPRVIGLSLLPLLIAGLLCWGFMYFFWESTTTAVRAGIENWALAESLLRWFDAMGLEQFRSTVSLMIVLAVMLPVVMALSVLLVALLMTPAIVKLVAERRFPLLERREGGSMLQGLAQSLGATVVALVLLLMSMPFWLIPPLVLILPPLIWGWLTYKVFGFDVLAEHASTQERRRLLREHRMPMLAIGVISGYLGAAPTLIFSLSVMAIVLAPFLILVSVWLYMLVFAFSTAWFTHYALASLQELRGRQAEAATVLEPPLLEPLPPQ